MGSGIAHQLARSGRRVLGLDRHHMSTDRAADAAVSAVRSMAMTNDMCPWCFDDPRVAWPSPDFPASARRPGESPEGNCDDQHTGDRQYLPERALPARRHSRARLRLLLVLLSSPIPPVRHQSDTLSIVGCSWPARMTRELYHIHEIKLGRTNRTTCKTDMDHLGSAVGTTVAGHLSRPIGHLGSVIWGQTPTAYHVHNPSVFIRVYPWFPIPELGECTLDFPQILQHGCWLTAASRVYNGRSSGRGRESDGMFAGTLMGGAPPNPPI